MNVCTSCIKAGKITKPTARRSTTAGTA
jgi:hypothetical protein